MRYNVQDDGTAGAGKKVGDEIVTGGGMYTITGINPDGTYTSVLSDPNMKTQQMTPEQQAALAAGKAAQGSNSSGSAADRVAEDYINSIYEAQIEANKAALKAAYDQNVSTLNATKEKIPAAYALARNQTASESETQRANFNEYAAASGLNSGTGGQASLAFSNQLQGNLGALNQSQADALADLDLQVANLTTRYQTDLAQAFAEGNINKIAALYDNYQSNKANMLSQRQFDANLKLQTASYSDQKSEAALNRALQTAQITGDYSGMAAYGWTPEQIEKANNRYKMAY